MLAVEMVGSNQNLSIICRANQQYLLKEKSEVRQGLWPEQLEDRDIVCLHGALHMGHVWGGRPMTQLWIC